MKFYCIIFIQNYIAYVLILNVYVCHYSYFSTYSNWIYNLFLEKNKLLELTPLTVILPFTYSCLFVITTISRRMSHEILLTFSTFRFLPPSTRSNLVLESIKLDSMVLSVSFLRSMYSAGATTTTSSIIIIHNKAFYLQLSNYCIYFIKTLQDYFVHSYGFNIIQKPFHLTTGFVFS